MSLVERLSLSLRVLDRTFTVDAPHKLGTFNYAAVMLVLVYIQFAKDKHTVPNPINHYDDP